MKRERHVFVDDTVDALLHPSQMFEHPSQVVNDADLSLNEKRAVLASWASDACAVEAAPALRKGPTGRVVEFDEIMDALRALDREGRNPAHPHKRVLFAPESTGAATPAMAIRAHPYIEPRTN